MASSAALMLPGAWGHSATVVEFAQLPAGLAAWQRGSLGVYRVCGPASKLLYALPAHLAGIRVDYPEEFDSDARSRREWELGRIFQDQNIERYHDVYRWSRLLPILVTVLGGCLVCEWSTQLFGVLPGVASLCVWCWSPPILAHGSLITSDMPAAVAALAAARAFWDFLLKPLPTAALLAGATLGLAMATKFTLLIFYPVWGILLIGRAIQLRGTVTLWGHERSMLPIRFVASSFAIMAISLVVVDALYLFQDVGFRLADWKSDRSSIARVIHDLESSWATSWLLQIRLPIPLELLRGLDFQLADTERVQSAYLLGRTRVGGWWYWHLAASSIKIPLPVLALFALALTRTRRAFQDSNSGFWAGLCLLVPAVESALAVAASTGTGTNAAFRYMTPSIALLCVWGGLAYRGSRLVRRGTVGLLAWLLVDAVVGAPDHLGWRNEAGLAWERWSGRPTLIGDSLDWGQDLARLGDWVSRRTNDSRMKLFVYGAGQSMPYRLEASAGAQSIDTDLQTKYTIISVNLLYGYCESPRVEIDGWQPPPSSALRSILLSRSPDFMIGRTLYVYIDRSF